MLINFEKYSDGEIRFMVRQCFDTIEKTGIWNQDSFVYEEWINIHESQSYLNISNFLDELYFEFAKRYNLFKNYREYLKNTLDNNQKIEESKQFITLPCNVGDKIYLVYDNIEVPIDEFTVSKIIITDSHCIIVDTDGFNHSCGHKFKQTDGKYICLTYEEAKNKRNKLKEISK